MKKRKAKSSSQDKYDTFSITMELERPLLYNNEDNAEKNKQENEVNKAKKMKKKIYNTFNCISIICSRFFHMVK